MRAVDILSETPQWNDKYLVGVESIDREHKEIFTIVQRLHKLLVGTDKDKWACQEAIKYLKSYTIRHFEDEEAYMKSVGFIGLEGHRQEHIKMRDETIPALQKMLMADDYSEASIKKFLDACCAWLHNHILKADQLIGRYALQKVIYPL